MGLDKEAVAALAEAIYIEMSIDKPYNYVHGHPAEGGETAIDGYYNLNEVAAAILKRLSAVRIESDESASAPAASFPT